MPDRLGTEEGRRLTRRLLARVGRGYAEAFGFSVTSNPSSLFRLLLLCVLTSGQREYRRALSIAEALVRQGWDSAARLAGSGYDERVAVIGSAGGGRGGGRGAERWSATLGDLATEVTRRYGGDLRRLRGEAKRGEAKRGEAKRGEAKRDAAALRRLLTGLPGVTDAAVDLFFRDVQVIWPEAGPFADRRSLRAAARLGLGGSVADLDALTAGRSEKLAWLAGALARVDLEGRYDEIRALPRG
jgi:hypothetical protein